MSLNLSRDGTRLTVGGDGFEIVWDGDAGGEIAEIRQYDGEAWLCVNAAAFGTVPGLVLTRDGREYPLNAERGVLFEVEKNTPREARFSVSVKAAGITVGVRYIVYEEGVLFAELSLPKSELVDGKTQGVDSDANKALLDGVRGRLGIHLDSAITANKFAWGHIPRFEGPLEVGKKKTDRTIDDRQMLPIAMADYGRRPDGGYHNHLEFFIEDSPPDGAGTWFGDDGNGGFKFEWTFAGKALRNTYFVTWDMGFFRTRWGLCLGSARIGRRGAVPAAKANNLIGARILHVEVFQGVGPELQDKWPYNVPPADLIRNRYHGLPSDREIEQAHRKGANVIILHQGWMRSGGSNCEPPADYIPRDPAELARFVQTCHRLGIRVGLYMRGTENYALFQPYFERFLKKDFDGLYVDWSSPCCMGYQGCSYLHFSAMNYFLLTRALRERVGAGGFLIAHSGGRPTLLATAVFDAYLPGEYRNQRENLHNSPESMAMYGFASCMGNNLIPRLELPQAPALYAALGFHPHRLWKVGEQIADSPLDPLWKMWASVPLEQAVVYSDMKEHRRVVNSTNPDFRSILYRVGDDRMLLMAANFGEAGKTRLTLDMTALEVSGEFRIMEMNPDHGAGLVERDLGIMRNGAIETGELGRHDYRGFRLTRC
ncbi:MAG: hypothetical protein PHR35_07215 [Kiritimatiellae bacterium]|nr:hypothetical protein [Kiritimatiellia bacterium]